MERVKQRLWRTHFFKTCYFSYDSLVNEQTKLVRLSYKSVTKNVHIKEYKGKIWNTIQLE